MSLPSNLQNLTTSHNIIAAKKARNRAQLKEVLFDDNARRDFLTGFHKRKLAKAEAARSKAKERQKQERLQARREQRLSLREQATQNAAQVEKAYGAHIEEDDQDQEEEWTGISHHRPNGEHADEYEDEEQLATVTVVEDFDPDSLTHGPPRSDIPFPSSSSSQPTPSPRPTQAKPTPQKSTSTKPKPKKIRYETKAARQRERTKQHARRAEKAELAGGKASRKARSKTNRHNSKR